MRSSLSVQRRPPLGSACSRHRRRSTSQPASAHLRPLQQILALHKCHDDNPWAKYWGVCNDTLAELRACFKNEKRTKM